MRDPELAFFTVSTFAAVVLLITALLNTKEVGEKVSGREVGPLVPVPVRPTTWGLYATVALSVTEKPPFMVPFPVGANLTLTVHLASPANVAGLVEQGVGPPAAAWKFPLAP